MIPKLLIPTVNKCLMGMGLTNNNAPITINTKPKLPKSGCKNKINSKYLKKTLN